MRYDHSADGMVNGVATITRTDAGIEPIMLALEQVLKRDETGHVIRRSLDPRFYDAERYHLSPAGAGYFRPLFGDLPRRALTLDARGIDIGEIVNLTILQPGRYGFRTAP